MPSSTQKKNSHSWNLDVIFLMDATVMHQGIQFKTSIFESRWKAYVWDSKTPEIPLIIQSSNCVHPTFCRAVFQTLTFLKLGTTRNTSQYTFNVSKTITIHHKYISNLCVSKIKSFSPLHFCVKVL